MNCYQSNVPPCSFHVLLIHCPIIDETEETDQSSTISEQSSSQKYEQLTRDLDLIMSELSATQASQDVVDIRNPVITF